MKSLKLFEGWGTSLWNKYSTDIFFRTTCHIILLQIVLTAIIVTGLWFTLEYSVSAASEVLIDTFRQMLLGGPVTAEVITNELEEIQLDHYLPMAIIATGILISFSFIMIYVSMTPTRRSLERKKRFISNVSHELRTPLAIMRTNTDVCLLDSDTPPKVRQRLKRNLKEFERITEIMNNLLSLTNLMHGKELDFEDVDLQVVAQNAIDSLAESITHKDIAITLKSHTHQPVFGNASALEQVVFNLLKNSIAHISTSGIVTIEIERTADGKYIDLSVLDTGSGIPGSDLFYVLEPFYRSRKSGGDGQGLGLAIVNEIIQMHRGKIKIKSAEGRGTVVTVSLKRSEKGVMVHEQEDPKSMEEVSMDFSRRTIL